MARLIYWQLLEFESQTAWVISTTSGRQISVKSF